MESPSQIKEQIIKNSFWNIINSFINRIGGFVFVILLSRLLMPEGFGVYSLVMTISLFFITFSDLGINQTLIRYISLEIDRNNQKAVSYFKYLFRTRFLLTLSISLVFLIGAYPISLYIFNDISLFPYLVILSFYVFIVSLTGFFESLFFIKKNVKYISLKESVSLILKIIAIITIGYFIIPEYKLFYIFFSFIGISLLAFFLVLYFSKHSYPFLFRKNKKDIDKRGIAKFIFLLNIQNISLMILSQASIILIGIYLTKEYVGYYNAAWALVAGIISLLFSFSSMFISIFTSINEETFQHLLKKIFRLFFIFALPISFGLSLLSKFFIVTIYGEEYLPASASLSILAFLIPCMIGIDLAIASFSARNKQRKFSIIMLASALIFLFLNYIFIKFLSPNSGELIITGISVINLITWLFCFIGVIYLLKKEVQVNIISFHVIKLILSCFVMSAFILLSLHFFKDINLLRGMLIVSSSAVIYFLFLFLIRGITKEDFSLIREIYKKKKN